MSQNGAVVTRYTYEPYGQQTSPNPAAVDPVDRNPFRYAAGYYDTTTGMLKYGTRYYLPNLMRWTQPDPVAGKPTNPMSLNPYIYVGCNPTNYTDATGRDADLWSLTWACLESAAFYGTFGMAAGTLVPAVGTVGGAIVGALEGCTLGILSQGIFGLNITVPAPGQPG